MVDASCCSRAFRGCRATDRPLLSCPSTALYGALLPCLGRKYYVQLSTIDDGRLRMFVACRNWGLRHGGRRRHAVTAQLGAPLQTAQPLLRLLCLNITSLRGMRKASASTMKPLQNFISGTGFCFKEESRRLTLDYCLNSSTSRYCAD